MFDRHEKGCQSVGSAITSIVRTGGKSIRFSCICQRDAFVSNESLYGRK